jgi:hypothetical protein
MVFRSDLRKGASNGPTRGPEGESALMSEHGREGGARDKACMRRDQRSSAVAAAASEQSGFPVMPIEASVP